MHGCAADLLLCAHGRSRRHGLERNCGNRRTVRANSRRINEIIDSQNSQIVLTLGTLIEHDMLEIYVYYFLLLLLLLLLIVYRTLWNRINDGYTRADASTRIFATYL